MSTANPSRKRLVPEMVQTSAMDCGPAALGSFLLGHGVDISYPALRQACHTDVDGTSIDTLEELAVKLGVDAEQVMVPADHLLLGHSQNLPAILIVNNPDGTTHFVVVWRRAGKRLQIMDPAIGRRWVPQRQIIDEAFRHRMAVPADDWFEWASSDDFLNGLRERLRTVTHKTGSLLIKRATTHTNWRALARLDAVTRLTQSLIDANLIRPGRMANALVESMLKTDSIDCVDDVPEQFWSAYPLENDSESLQLRGVVLVRSRGKIKTGAQPTDQLQQSVTAQRPINAARYIAAKIVAAGPFWLLSLLVGLILAASSVVLEALLFRGAIDITSQLRLTEQRWVAVGYFLAFIAAMLFVEWNVVGAILAAGRRLEIGLRVDFLKKMVHLKDRYFGSRPISDMAHRAHNVHHVRELPGLVGQTIQIVITILLTATALCLIFPGGRALAIAAAASAILLPWTFRRQLLERDLKVRTHAGALSNSYFDALAGLIPIRAHGAQRKMRQQHEALLTKWAESSLQLVDSIVLLESLVMVSGFGLAAALVGLHFQLGENPAGSLLVAYWALHLPVLGDQLSEQLVQYPFHRNLVHRAIEPISVATGLSQNNIPAGSVTKNPLNQSHRPGLELELRNATVLAGGQPIISDINLQIDAGEHVAIIGVSGAGKSSLAGLLLGVHESDQGEVLVNGSKLKDGGTEALRAKTAWVDPNVQLWNDTLLANLFYGNGQPKNSVDRIFKTTGLDDLIARLPNGLQTVIGENGTLLSAGQAQLVRFARALLKPNCELVILDEPLFGIDPEVQHQLLETSREQWATATMLLVTHQLQQALTFSRVVVMDGGKIIEDGCPQDLARNSKSRFAQMLLAEQGLERQYVSSNWRTLRLEPNGMVEVPHLNFSDDRAVKHA